MSLLCFFGWHRPILATPGDLMYAPGRYTFRCAKCRKVTLQVTELRMP